MWGPGGTSPNAVASDPRIPSDHLHLVEGQEHLRTVPHSPLLALSVGILLSEKGIISS